MPLQMHRLSTLCVSIALAVSATATAQEPVAETVEVYRFMGSQPTWQLGEGIHATGATTSTISFKGTEKTVPLATGFSQDSQYLTTEEEIESYLATSLSMHGTGRAEVANLGKARASYGLQVSASRRQLSHKLRIVHVLHAVYRVSETRLLDAAPAPGALPVAAYISGVVNGGFIRARMIIESEEFANADALKVCYQQAVAAEGQLSKAVKAGAETGTIATLTAQLTELTKRFSCAASLEGSGLPGEVAGAYADVRGIVQAGEAFRALADRLKAAGVAGSTTVVAYHLQPVQGSAGTALSVRALRLRAASHLARSLDACNQTMSSRPKLPDAQRESMQHACALLEQALKELENGVSPPWLRVTAGAVTLVPGAVPAPLAATCAKDDWFMKSLLPSASLIAPLANRNVVPISLTAGVMTFSARVAHIRLVLVDANNTECASIVKVDRAHGQDFGPPKSLPTGRYQIRFYLQVLGGTGESGPCMVVSEPFSLDDLPPHEIEVEVPFSMTYETDVSASGRLVLRVSPIDP